MDDVETPVALPVDVVPLGLVGCGLDCMVWAAGTGAEEDEGWTEVGVLDCEVLALKLGQE
jgi:hypothetical protein